MTRAYSQPKNSENISKHGISFDRIADFDWDNALTMEDTRFDYGESRFISYGMIDNRLYVLVWTPRDDIVRPISLRKANARERKYYEEIE
jgi:uncharacterized protein